MIAALQDEDVHVREDAARALGLIRDGRAVEPLVAALKDDDSMVRDQATTALVETGAPAVEALVAALQDVDLDVRIRAARALGAIQDAAAFENAGAVEALVGLLKDESMSYHAGQALLEIGGPAVESLIATLQDDNPVIRFRAAQVLEEIDDERAVEPFLNAFKNEDMAVIVGAYGFYIRRGEPGSETVLIRALNAYKPYELITNDQADMAAAFINCGNDLLSAAGFEWAEAHDYIVTSSPGGGSGLSWASGR